MRAELSPAEVDELIQESLGEARAAVKERLRAKFERELEAQVEARRGAQGAGRRGQGAGGGAQGADIGARGAGRHEAEADRPELGDGLWLYCVTRSPEPPQVDGVASGHAPRVVAANGLSALVSSVPLAEFGEEPLKRNLNELPWLERVARAHESVLEAALRQGPIVPMRLCTIYRGEQQIREMLEQRGRELSEALESLQGRNEWGVKVSADRDRLTERLRDRAERRPVGSGGAYLGRKRDDLRLRDEVDATLDAAVRESHARLEEWAAATNLLPPQRPELNGQDGEMVMNGAYLVDDERLEGFREVVAELGRQYGPDSTGLTFELTGPWPPFNFMGDTE